MEIRIIQFKKSGTKEFSITSLYDNDIGKALSDAWLETQGGLSESLGRDSAVDAMRKQGDFVVRSSMVGDVLVIGERYFICDSIGFVEIDAETYARYKTVPWTDKALGWDYVRERHSVGLHIQLIDEA